MKAITKYIKQDAVSDKLAQILGDQKETFVTSALQAIADNRLLQKATPESVYGSVMASAVMKLPINNNLGYAYIVPYNKKVKEGNKWVVVQEAQLQIGWKGFVNLAVRTGQYKTIHSTEIYENQYAGKDVTTGEININNVEPEGEVVGYLAHFEMLSGYRKSLYMTKEQVNAHGVKYSKSYDPKDDKKKNSLWVTDFDSMAKKTVLKLLLSKFGMLSLEMQKAVEYDQGVIRATSGDEHVMSAEYPDNPQNETPEEAKENLKEKKESGEQQIIDMP